MIDVNLLVMFTFACCLIIDDDNKNKVIYEVISVFSSVLR